LGKVPSLMSSLPLSVGVRKLIMKRTAYLLLS
jgi:hypothetical protein